MDEDSEDAVLSEELDELLTELVLIELELVLIDDEEELELLSVLEELVEISSIERTWSDPNRLLGPGNSVVIVAKLNLSGAPTVPSLVVSISSAVQIV